MSVRGAAPFVVLTVLVLTPVLRGDAEFFYRDVTRQYAPVQAQLSRAWAAGELPTWNASTQSGVPLLANVHAGAFAPWWPLFRALDFSRAYGLSVALAWAALMAGLFAFFRGRALGAGASLFGALAGGFSGVVLGATTYLPFLAGVACIPWQLVALDEPRAGRRVLLLSVLFTVQVLTGDPSTAFMGGLACLLVGGARAASLAGAGVLALGLSALQLLPAATLYGESSRAASNLASRLEWSFHPARALEWVVRLPFGGLMEAPFFTRWELAAGPDAQPFFLEHGWGLWGLLLVLPALFTRGPLRRAGLGLVSLGLLLSLGSHLGPSSAVFELPPLSFFRFPERYAALTVLGAAMLTAHGAQALLGDARARSRWALGWLALAALAGASAFATDGVTQDALRWTAAAVLLAGGLGFVLAPVRWAWVLGLLALGSVDAGRAVQASVLTLPPSPELAGEVRAPGSGGHRLWRENAPLRALERPVRGRDAFAEERRLLHATFASATPGLHGVDELGGYSPVVLRRWQKVLQTSLAHPELLARLFDVCWFVSTSARGAANPSWRPVRTLAPQTLLFESNACAGRAWTVGWIESVDSLDEALAQLAAPAFDASRVATREGGEPLAPLETTRVTMKPRARASELELDVEPVEGWALVVVSESWAPGWSVFVDGEERPVELLDGALLGVAVPPGRRAVRFVYTEPLFEAGAAISLATLLAWVLLARRAWRTA